jgi:terminase small subunit|nr:MAG TPA: Terminase small subunit [Caudoviricetes sp.]
MEPKKKLTEKQRRFIDFYIKSGNATEAAIKAGYSKKTAKAAGYENLTKPYLKTAISNRLKEMEDARIADAREVLVHLTSAMRGEVKEEVIVCEGIGDGLSAARIMKKQISAHDRLRAAELLMKRYGLTLSDIEKEEKQAKIDALKKDTKDDPAADGVIITGEDDILE